MLTKSLDELLEDEYCIPFHPMFPERGVNPTNRAMLFQYGVVWQREGDNLVSVDPIAGQKKFPILAINAMRAIPLRKAGYNELSATHTPFLWLREGSVCRHRKDNGIVAGLCKGTYYTFTCSNPGGQPWFIDDSYEYLVLPCQEAALYIW